MIFGGDPFGCATVGGMLLDPGTADDARAVRPLTLEWLGLDAEREFQINSFTLTDTGGEPMTAEFVLESPSFRPFTGQPIRINYYAETLFAGIIDRAVLVPTQDNQARRWQISATDHARLLMKRRIARSFTNVSVAEIVSSVLENEAAGDGLGLGRVDVPTILPLVEARRVRVFDLFRDLAGVTGQAMLVTADKRVNFYSTTTPLAPKILDEETVISHEVVEDLEGYRNRQIVIVTGTPAGNEIALVIQEQRENGDQIAERQAIEGGSGIYEEIEELTHPTSNILADLQNLAAGYAELRLEVNGQPRTILKVRTRGYGFRAGQLATVDLPMSDISGTWIIQRASCREREAATLFYDLELAQTSIQMRAWEAWLRIVQAGKIIVQRPGAPVQQSITVTFDTPGATNWIVPASVTEITATAIGASGGGAHVSEERNAPFCTLIPHNGGKGGNGGKAVSVVSVTPGQQIDIVVGTRGAAGASLQTTGSALCHGLGGNAEGGDATITSVSRGGISLAEAEGGEGGHVGGANGAPGGASGGIVTVGGGNTGGAGGDYWKYVNQLGGGPQPGQHGRVLITYVEST